MNYFVHHGTMRNEEVCIYIVMMEMEVLGNEGQTWSIDQ